MRVLLALLFLCGFLSAATAQQLQPGDTIDISVWQDPKLDRRVVVSPTGTISMPLAGHIRAAGLTTEQLESILRTKLQNNFATDRLDISVALASRREDDDLKPRIYVTGEILKPGYFPITNRLSVMQAIAMAGGFGPFAAKGRVQVRRKINGSESVLFFDYNAFESGTKLSGNIDLKGGDVIVVPERGLFEF